MFGATFEEGWKRSSRVSGETSSVIFARHRFPWRADARRTFPCSVRTIKSLVSNGSPASKRVAAVWANCRLARTPTHAINSFSLFTPFVQIHLHSRTDVISRYPIDKEEKDNGTRVRVEKRPWHCRVSRSFSSTTSPRYLWSSHLPIPSNEYNSLIFIYNRQREKVGTGLASCLLSFFFFISF